MSAKQDVIFTGTRDGLYLVLNDRQDLKILKEKIKSHLEKSELFFQGAQVILDVGDMNLGIDEILDIQNAVFGPHGLLIKKVVRKNRAGVLGRAGRVAEGEIPVKPRAPTNLPGDPDGQEGRRRAGSGGMTGSEGCPGEPVELLGAERKETLYREVSRKLLEGRPSRRRSGTDVESGAGLGTETLLHRGTVRSGQRIYHPGNIVILGDVNPGALVQAGGDIVVMGALRGIAHAGAGGDVESAIYALKLEPTQIRIANVIGRPPEGEARESGTGPETARLKDGAIIIEAMENAR